MFTTIETELRSGTAIIWLNRPELRNAMNEVMIGELNQALENAIGDDAIRTIVLAGRGKSFCAGGDLNWMRRAKDMSPTEAKQDSAHLARLLQTLYLSPKPTVARVQGSAFAGGLGLVAACDIAVAANNTQFCLSEVKLGLIPSTISPYVVRAMGERMARRYCLSAEVFSGAEAWRIGLVSELCPPEELDLVVNQLLGQLQLAGPKALAQTKQLLQDVTGQSIGDSLSDMTANRIAHVRASDEAQEGIAAFFDKRPANWVNTIQADKT
jgi:methylglutaconyl-CoA hydratase